MFDVERIVGDDEHKTSAVDERGASRGEKKPSGIRKETRREENPATQDSENNPDGPIDQKDTETRTEDINEQEKFSDSEGEEDENQGLVGNTRLPHLQSRQSFVLLPANQHWYKLYDQTGEECGRILLSAKFATNNFSRSSKSVPRNERKHPKLFPVYLNPVWQPDSASAHCVLCREDFTMFRRRHHCRVCGVLCCKDCMAKRKVDDTKSLVAVNCCDTCTNTLEPDGLFTSSWEPDQGCDNCHSCRVNFSFVKRRSHCRVCGFIFCRECLDQLAVVDGSKQGKVVQVCHICSNHLHDNRKGIDQGEIRLSVGDRRSYSTFKTSADNATGRFNIEVEGDIQDAEEWLEQQREGQPKHTGHRGSLFDMSSEAWEVPKMNILILIVGSRGDVQPFLPLALKLKNDGHRVRVATHECFREFVTDQCIEFFPLGGDPKELMEYMVRTGGSLLPNSIEQLKQDVPNKRKMIKEILKSTWLAATTNEEGDDSPTFIADALISNPPTYGHYHVAEALYIPLHMFFTMPWSPTRSFPHPLAYLKNSSSASIKNYLSFQIVDQIIWTGCFDMVNKFRLTQLGLKPIRTGESGADVLNRKQVPFAYMWSPSLIPKPKDWGAHIDVVGFNFLQGSGMSSWDPSPELKSFLDHPQKPVFIGFGSCVVKNPVELTEMIFKAAEQTQTRVVLQSGWSGLGKNPDFQDGDLNQPETLSSDWVTVIGPAPHDWLFTRCRAVCHHGGAGTCAAGLIAGLPTIIVPFFGDQHFWGAMVARAGAGPKPIPYAEVTTEKLANAFRFVSADEVRDKAVRMSECMKKEDGAALAMEAFYWHLPLEAMTCDLDSRSLAKVYCHECRLKLSIVADQVVHAEPKSQPLKNWDCPSCKFRITSELDHFAEVDSKMIMSTPSALKCEVCNTQNPATVKLLEAYERNGHKRSLYRYVDWGQSTGPSGPLSGVTSGVGGALDHAALGLKDLITSTTRGAAKQGTSGAAQGALAGVGKTFSGTIKAGVVLVDSIGKGLSKAGGEWGVRVKPKEWGRIRSRACRRRII